MAGWIPVGADFIEADVIRWTEGIFNPQRRMKTKPERLGQRLVAAEVLEKGRDWVHLEVRHCELIAFRSGDLPEAMFLLRAGTTMKRRPSTIAKGAPERLAWSDERARSILIQEDEQAPDGNGQASHLVAG